MYGPQATRVICMVPLWCQITSDICTYGPQATRVLCMVPWCLQITSYVPMVLRLLPRVSYIWRKRGGQWPHFDQDEEMSIHATDKRRFLTSWVTTKRQSSIGFRRHVLNSQGIFQGINLETLDFPLNWNSKNKPF